MISVINCSTVYAGLPLPEAVAAAQAAGFQAVELWWPFAEEVPDSAEVAAMCELFAPAGQAGEHVEQRGQGEQGEQSGQVERQRTQQPARPRLHAMNLYGGDMAAGQRGVLHQRQLHPGHLEAVAEIARRTGLRYSNVLLGRSGSQVSAAQISRIEELVRHLSNLGVTALIEPLSGMADYPIRDALQAAELAQATGAGVLADFYHLAANGVDIADYLARVRAGATPLPAHVQVADFPGRGAPGTAAAPLAQWVEQLQAAGYSGEVAGEWLAS